jgi:hypothetical protein
MKKHSIIKLGLTILFVLYVATPSRATTWYVRTDGGAAYDATARPTGQCNGQSDLPAAGATAHNCAFNNPHYLWGNDIYGETPTWKITSGDTVIIGDPDGGTNKFRIGYKGPNNGDYWGQCPGDPYGCFNPQIPAGTSSNPTKIYGRNYASCNAQNTTQLYGGYGAATVLNLNGAQNVVVQCLEITDHAQCAYNIGNSNQCTASYPIDDYAKNGISSNTGTSNITLKDIYVHGLADGGWIGPIGGNVTWTNGAISYNPAAGFNLDDGSGTGSTGGTFSLTNVMIQFNGCIEQYPITNSLPAFKCFDSEYSGGYGDAIGTPDNDKASWAIDKSTVRYNTQDGIDLLHTATANVSITHTASYGNMGQQVKLGAFTSSILRNNLITTNCRRMSDTIAGTPSGYNSALFDFCRGNDGIAINWGGTGTSSRIENNTIVGYEDSTLSTYCDLANCSGGTKSLQNNIVYGYSNPNYKSGQLPGLIYYGSGTSSTLWTSRSNNIFFNLRNGGCPTGFSNESCSDPQLQNTPAFVNEATLDSLNLHLKSTSPAKDAGVTLTGFLDDYIGNTRPVGPAWDIGAYEYVPLLISEFRLRGPNGASDEFVKIYNLSVEASTVQSADGSTGYALAASDGAARFVIPNGTVIPSRGHYLGVNSSGYSLGTVAPSDVNYTSDIADNTGLALFSTANPTNFTAAYTLDAVGFGSAASPYAEGTTLSSIGTSNGEYSLVRKISNTSSVPQDTNSNASDFLFISTTGGVFNAVQSVLGAPGPENLTSPRLNNSVMPFFVQPLVSSTVAPNRAVISCGTEGAPACVANESYLAIRRGFINKTGANVTRLRFRMIDLTTLGNSGAGIAELHVVTSSTATISDGLGGMITVGGTTLETPPSQPNGGGINSSFSAPTITLATPLAPGNSINLQFMAKKISGGSFRFFFVVEALP